MIFLLDTNTCIRFLNGTSESVRRRMADTERGDVSLCSIVRAVLVFGALKSALPQQNLSSRSPGAWRIWWRCRECGYFTERSFFRVSCSEELRA